MFGSKLKSWMEAHLGRPKHKSSSSNGVTSNKHSSSGSTPTFPSTGQRLQSTSNPSSVPSLPGSETLPGCVSGNGEQSFLDNPAKRQASTPNPYTPGSSMQEPDCNLPTEKRHINDSGGEHQGHGSSSQISHHSSLAVPPGQSSQILLGSFSHNLNLSSPDTGYSTDGYSPKSGYPALSFESSGKSTPKSSYTISSLVSSERLHLNNSIGGSYSTTASSSASKSIGPSKNSSISNGLELEEDHPPSSVNLQFSHPLNGAPLSSVISCKIENSNLSSAPSGSSPCPSSSSSVVPSFPNDSDKISKSNANPALSPPIQNNEQSHKIHHHPPSNLNHKRAESMGEERKLLEGFDPPPRSIRTSLLLSNQIPEECSPALKNAYSICSPRRQRTRIKTNPWVSLNQHQDNFHVNYSRNKMPEENNEDKNSNTKNNHSELSPALQPPTHQVSSPPPPPPSSTSHSPPAPLPPPPLTSVPDSTEPLLVLRYRISTSTSASDSGKGTLEPSTNRNSTESSQLLSDTTSTPGSPRNSIISPEISNSNTATTSPVHTLQNSSSSAPLISTKSSSSSSTYSNPSTRLTTSHSSSQPSQHCPHNSLDPSNYIPPTTEKETDILSDWPNTDDEEGPLRQEDPDPTPTPSSPDLHTFNNSSSSSSKLEFIPSSRPPGLPHNNHHPSNIRLPPRPSRSTTPQSVPHNMNLPTTTTTCYPLSNLNLPAPPLHIPDPYALDNLNHHHHFLLPASSPPENSTSDTYPGLFPHATTSLLQDTPDLSSTKSSALTRGAIGFFRKIFRKGSCASSRASSSFSTTFRNSPITKSKLFRSSSSSRSNGSDLDNNIDNNTIIPVSLLSPETVVVSNYPLANTKPLSPAINSSFLTPTPNAFRRHRSSVNPPSGATLSSSDLSEPKYNSSKPRAPIKTDIIRLPQPLHHPPPPPPDSTDSSDIQNSLPSPRIPYHPMYRTNSNTNSTTGSSLNSLSIMSTSTTASKASEDLDEEEEEEATPILAHRQYPSPLPPPRQSNNKQVSRSSSESSKNHRSHSSNNNNYPSPLPRSSKSSSGQHPPPLLDTAAHPTPSPRLPSRMASPSFNNYSPIHRLVVTGGNHFLPRHHPPSSTFHPSSAATPAASSSSTYTNNPPLGPPPPPPAPSHPSPYLNQQPPSINHRHLASTLNSSAVLSSPHQSYSQSPQTPNYYYTHHPPHLQQLPPATSSSSPVLRNPRYQYITSSNQNSPLLNVQKRLHPDFDTLPTPQQFQHLQQNTRNPTSAYPHPHPPISSNKPNKNNKGAIFSHHHRPPPDDHQHHQSHYYSSPVPSLNQSNRSRRRPSPQGAERIYESVDISESETSRSDDGDGDGGDFEFQVPPHNHFPPPNYHHHHPRGSVPTRQTFQPGNPYSRGETRDYPPTHQQIACDIQQLPQQQHPPPRRLKPNFVLPLHQLSDYRYSHAHPYNPPIPPPRSTPLSMGTFLSETETRLLEGDTATDLRYKRLIREAETLLKEISIQKTNQPWLSHYRAESLKHEECPQSDPLRRKAYDCWALRRLQQELAGCCASPPVLHRSRLHITSPMSPNQNHNFIPPQNVAEIPSHAHILQNRRSSLNVNGNNVF